MTLSSCLTSVGPRWHAIYTLPRIEAVAQKQLDRQGLEVFFRRMWQARRHVRRIKLIRAFMFPCYGFARFDAERGRWRSINGTLGVSGIAMARERPQPVPCGVVEAMVAATAENGITVVERSLKKGVPVRLVSGPFAGGRGILERLDARGRVALLLSLMNGSVRLKICRDMIAPAGCCVHVLRVLCKDEVGRSDAVVSPAVW
ncbi:transcription termination/antitermination NusG family protein [Xanthobacter sp.]|uniref:transcription termination/antitermination protein NusG n=1 Tax=Xanthobacter sp. TaxID=35809 RepID=UPI0025FF53DF|nr:transcription termination/antitermination NusG family protein [Xanthobacter sp.]